MRINKNKKCECAECIRPRSIECTMCGLLNTAIKYTEIKIEKEKKPIRKISVRRRSDHRRFLKNDN